MSGGKMSESENVWWENVLIGKGLAGKCPEMIFRQKNWQIFGWKMSEWEIV